jgi:hypothetical protein
MNTSPHAPASHPQPDTPPHANGRDRQERFTTGNPGGVPAEVMLVQLDQALPGKPAQPRIEGQLWRPSGM